MVYEANRPRIKELKELCTEINDGLGYDIASIATLNGKETVRLHMDSVISSSLSNADINKLISDKEDKLKFLYSKYPSLKFFNPSHKMVNKVDFEGSSGKVVEQNLNENAEINILKEIALKKNASKLDREKQLKNSVKLINKILVKKYAVFSKKGILINHPILNNLILSNFEIELLNIESIEDTIKVLQNICMEYPDLKTLVKPDYVDSFNNSNIVTKCSNKISLNFNSIDSEVQFRLARLNKVMNKKLFYSASNGLYIKEKAIKKKIKVDLGDELTNEFLAIKDNESLNLFLIKLEDSCHKFGIKKIERYLNNKIYISSKGFLDAELLEKNIDKANNYLKNPLLKLDYIGLCCNNKLLPQNIVDELYDISSDEKLFIGLLFDNKYIKETDLKYLCDEKLEKTLKEKLFEVDIFNKYVSGLIEFVPLVKRNLIFEYKEVLGVSIPYKNFNLYDDFIKISKSEPTIDRYSKTIECKHKLYSLKISKLNKSVSVEFTYNNDIVKLAEKIVDFYRGDTIYMFESIRDIILSVQNSYIKKALNKSGDIESLSAKDKIELKNILADENFLKKEFIKFSSKNKTLRLFNQEFDIDNIDNDKIMLTVKECIVDKLNKSFKAYLEHIEKQISSVKDNEYYFKDECFASILYLVSEVKNKGRTTYRDILLGSKREYASNKLYGKLETLSKAQIAKSIDELENEGFLKVVSKIASFGRYEAIVLGDKVNKHAVELIKKSLFGFADNCSVIENCEVAITKIDGVTVDELDLSIKSKENVFILNRGSSVSVYNKKLSSKNVVSMPVLLKLLTKFNKTDFIINSYKVESVEIEDFKDINKIISSDKKMIYSNWESISRIIPILDKKIITFLKLQYNLESDASTKKVIGFIIDTEINKSKIEGGNSCV